MTPPPSLVDRLVDAWCARDRAHAFVKTDHEVIASTAATRAVAAERLVQTAVHSSETRSAQGLAAEVDRDLLHAFAAIGRIVGERGGSPTLAAAIVDGARWALDAIDAPAVRASHAEAAWVMPARAALAEAFTAARLDGTIEQAARRWEYPTCAVGLPEESIAIAAGYPEDDADALAAWASRVAHQAALAGVRRAVVSGSRAAEAALAEALEIAGIERLAACVIGGRGRARG